MEERVEELEEENEVTVKEVFEDESGDEGSVIVEDVR